MHYLPDRSLRGHLRRPAVAVGALVAAGTAGAALTLAGVRSPVTGALTLLFLLTAPAAGAALPLRGLDRPARAVIAGAAALVVDTAVAETMLATARWSPRGGIVAVGAVSLSLAALSAAVRRRSAGAGGAAAPEADPNGDESWIFRD